MPLTSVALLSLEPWDDVWRRNQHLAAELVRQDLVRRIVFIEPARPGRGRRWSPLPGVEVVRPPLLIPRRRGGLRAVAFGLRARALRGHDRLWVNDASIGALCIGGRPALYDVTDDWRAAEAPEAELRRLVQAEDRLTERATVVVCSGVLQQRWQERYGVLPPVVHNAADVAAYRTARPVPLDGAGPHIGYIGTLHHERLDLDILLALADDPRVGTVHLVGPDHLPTADRIRLIDRGIVLHGPVPAADVPAWAVAFDVLVCPHQVTDFTRSLDAIKAYEYLAAGRPVVATPTGGFQDLAGQAGVTVVDATGLVAAVAHAAAEPIARPGGSGPSWAERAREFAVHLEVGP